ncbi:hypothetical protein CsatB_006101 [Cannabis sativa]
MFNYSRYAAEISFLLNLVVRILSEVTLSEVKYIIFGIRYEAEKAKEEAETAKKEVEKAKEEAEKALKVQDDEFKEKLAEKEIETVEWCGKVGFRVVYRAWLWNPNMDTSFWEEKEEETLALCEKTKMEEDDDKVEEEEETLSKSPNM